MLTIIDKGKIVLNHGQLCVIWFRQLVHLGKRKHNETLVTILKIIINLIFVKLIVSSGYIFHPKLMSGTVLTDSYSFHYMFSEHIRQLYMFFVFICVVWEVFFHSF